MIKPSLVDEVTVFLNRISALADKEHSDDFVALFVLPGCSVMTIRDTRVLDSEPGIRAWHQSVFELVEILKLNVDLLHCAQIDSMVMVQACFRCQFCFVDEPDQLEAMSIRMSLVIRKHNGRLKIVQMHCSVPEDRLRKGIWAEFVDPFADE